MSILHCEGERATVNWRTRSQMKIRRHVCYQCVFLSVLNEKPPFPDKPRLLCWQTHSTRHCHKVRASWAHGQSSRHLRPPATRLRFPPHQQLPRSSYMQVYKIKFYGNIFVVVSQAYLRRQRPPSCICVIRVAQIRGCTRTSLAHSSSTFADVHLERSMPLIWSCKIVEIVCLNARWAAEISACAPVVSAPLRGPAKLSLARHNAVPRSSQASRPPSGQARGCVSGFFSSTFQTRQGRQRARARSIKKWRAAEDRFNLSNEKCRG